jgi:predicted double-glycine peptidase
MIRAEIGLKNRLFMYIKHHTIIWRWYLLVVILKIDIKYTFLVRFHIFSGNDRLFID